MRLLATLVILNCFALGSAQADTVALPFKVSLNGNQAVTDSEEAPAALVESPVPPDAKIFVDTKDAQVMMDVIPINDAMQPVPGASSSILTLLNGEGTLLDTADHLPLTPGKYLASIAASGKTAKVVFEVD